MIWNQIYLLFGHGLGFSVVLASLPILTLVLILAVLRKAAWLAGLSGLCVTLLLAIFAYHMPPLVALSAAAYGGAFGLFPICWIIFWAIALFHVTAKTGKFEIIKDTVGKLTPDPRLQALLIAFAFGAFLEGAAGFGTPVAIASTMLIGLGFSAFSASAICLLANTAPVAFGSIGIPIITLAGTTGLPVNQLSFHVAALCTPIALIIPAYLIVSMGGFRSLKGILLPTITAGAGFAAVQLAVSTYLGPQLTDILAALASMALLIAVYRFAHNDEAVSSLSLENGSAASAWIRFSKSDGHGTQVRVLEETLAPDHSIGTILYAWMPYGLLVACVLLWNWKPFQTLLNEPTFTLNWPLLNDVVQRMPPITSKPTAYHAVFTLNWLAAAGTVCMIATLLSALLLRMSPRDFCRVIVGVGKQLRFPILTVSSVLALAFVMNYCGATATLGLAFAATGRLFPLFSALLGWLGVFLTGSDTSANALFGNLQVVTANRLGFDPVLMAAANSTGGVMGKMISLQTIAVAAAATGLTQAEQSKLFRFTLKHSILLTSLVGVEALLYTYILHL